MAGRRHPGGDSGGEGGECAVTPARLKCVMQGGRGEGEGGAAHSKSAGVRYQFRGSSSSRDEGVGIPIPGCFRVAALQHRPSAW